MSRIYRLGLTGWPLSHSLSPAIHRAALRSCQLQGHYDLLPLDPALGTEGMLTLTSRLKSGALDGLNVTIPHKQLAFQVCDQITERAAAIGAVNTLSCRNGRICGDITDIAGFLAGLDQLFEEPQPGVALILGAGGSARAVMAALAGKGWQVVVAARRSEQARALIQSLNIRFPQPPRIIPLNLEGLTGLSFNLLVNTTPLGMWPHTEGNPWPDGLPLPDGCSVYDLIYNPARTSLLLAAEKQGHRILNGLPMLVEQAALAFEIWTGQAPDRALMREAAVNEMKTGMQEAGG